MIDQDSTVHDKIVAMVSSSGEFVVKLPMAWVEELVIAGTGERFDANRGRPMPVLLPSIDLPEMLQLASANLAAADGSVDRTRP